MIIGDKGVLEFWKDMIETYNEDSKCDFCWNFFAPMTEKRLNIIRDITQEDDCCVNVFLLRNKSQDFGSRLTYNHNYLTRTYKTETYEVLFLIPSKEGLNNYNELSGHSLEESRYETIFKPLRDCISNHIITDICNHAPVTSWNGRYVYDYQDENFYGIRINITQEYEEL